MRVLHVVGARPNFMKTSPIMSAMNLYLDRFHQILVHTGQHYDFNMSKVFFEDLDMPEPDEFLNVGSGSHAEQTARIMLAFEPVVVRHKPDYVVVVGDVNSTLACGLVCAKVGIPVVHVEAGLRSGDKTMPEEINRILTDQISSLLFTPSRDADVQLQREGITRDRVRFVGNVMIDTLVKMLPKARSSQIMTQLGIQPGEYLLVTLHRPSNVDEPSRLKALISSLVQLSESWPVIFPVHPRTRKRIESSGVDFGSVYLVDPLGYIDFLSLMDSARLVITDSGGVQEETTYLGVPCVTVRPNTERPITITEGTNHLVDGRPDALIATALDVGRQYEAGSRTITRLEYWDGHAAERIAATMLELPRAGMLV